MRKASVVVLTLLSGLILVFSLVSAGVAYRSEARDEFGVGGATLSDLAAWNPEVATAIRARRGTASAFSAAFATLLLGVVLVPYRRGEVWAWWAILAALVVFAGVALARVPALGTRLGVAAALVLLAFGAVGLLLDVRRLRSA